MKFKKFEKIKSVPKNIPKSHNDDNLEQISNVPQNEPCDQNVPTGHIVRTF